MLESGMQSGDNKENRWWVYILESPSLALLYTGVTTDVPRRLAQHNGERSGGARATHRGRPWHLLHLEGPLGKVEAHRREYAIKRLPRSLKLALAMPGP